MDAATELSAIPAPFDANAGDGPDQGSAEFCFSKTLRHFPRSQYKNRGV
jgi:hypothetical protein